MSKMDITLQLAEKLAFTNENSTLSPREQILLHIAECCWIFQMFLRYCKGASLSSCIGAKVLSSELIMMF